MAGKVLVVDDSATMRQQLRTVLSTNGYQVYEAENGRVGLDTFKREKPDLLIVDVNMPVMGGIPMITELTAEPTAQRIPILMLTTESGADVVSKGKAAGATAWILKPFKPDLLLGSIQKLIGG